MRISKQLKKPWRSCLVGLLALGMLPLLGSTALGAAGLSVEPATWDFGSRDPGSGPSEPKIFTWTNTGDVGLSFFSEGVGSFTNDPQVFWWSSERTCIEELKPGESCTTSIAFNPSTPGRKHATLFLYPHVPAFPESVSTDVQLWGTGTGVEATTPLPPGPPIPAPGRVALLRHPQLKTTSRTAVFRFQTFVGTKYLCQLDNRREVGCRTPRTFNHLALGHHRLTIHAVNFEGIDGPTTSFGWFIGRQAKARAH